MSHNWGMKEGWKITMKLRYCCASIYVCVSKTLGRKRNGTTILYLTHPINTHQWRFSFSRELWRNLTPIFHSENERREVHQTTFCIVEAKIQRHERSAVLISFCWPFIWKIHVTRARDLKTIIKWSCWIRIFCCFHCSQSSPLHGFNHQGRPLWILAVIQCARHHETLSSLWAFHTLGPKLHLWPHPMKLWKASHPKMDFWIR